MSQSQWFVVRTNPCCDDRAMRNLSRAGFGVYQPIRQVERQHHRTKAWVTKSYPLMPGYLFLQMPHGPHDWWAVRRCEGVKGVLGQYDRDHDLAPYPIPSRLVELIIAAQMNQEFDKTRAATAHRGETARSKYLPGVTVMVRNHALASFGAEVRQVRANGTIDVLINIFGRMTPCELTTTQVELAAA